MRQGPLAGRYVAVAAMVMLALIPYLALSAALGPLTPIIGKQLHMSMQTLSLSSGLANAAYALGTVLSDGIRIRVRSCRAVSWRISSATSGSSSARSPRNRKSSWLGMCFP